jgi:ribosome recycling factor
MDANSCLKDAKNDFQKSIDYLKSEYNKVQAGKASPAILEDVKVDAYGMTQPLKSLAVITPQDAQTLNIKPFDKSVLKDIDSAIQAANLGLNPTNMGELLLITFPPLTEERRVQICKSLKSQAEDIKVSIRKARQKAQQRFKDLESEGEISKDELVGFEKKLQVEVDSANSDVDSILKNKEAEIMKV